jgi:hypothetical protein
MSWNGSNAGAARAAGTRGARGANPRRGDAAGRGASGGGLRVALGVVLCAAVLGGTWWWMTRRSTEPARPAAEKPKRPKSAPAEKPKRQARPVSDHGRGVEKAEKPSKPKPQRFGQYEVEVDENGERWIYRDGKRRHIMRAEPGTSRQLFRNHAENQLSALLTVKPGDMIVGFDIDDARFEKEFLESLKTPIEITDDDTPEEQEEKQLVIDAKNNLARYHKEGINIAQLVRDEYREIAKLNALKTDLKAELSRMRREGATPDEIRLQVEASNKMLEQYGMEHDFKLMRRERILLQDR